MTAAEAKATVERETRDLVLKNGEDSDCFYFYSPSSLRGYAVVKATGRVVPLPQ